MIIRAKIIPNSSSNKIAEKFFDEKNLEWLKIKIAAPAQDQQANEELVKFLAKHFGVAKSKIEILSGAKSKLKIIEIKDS